MLGGSVTIGCRRQNSSEMIRHRGKIVEIRLGKKMLSYRTSLSKSKKRFWNFRKSSKISTCFNQKLIWKWRKQRSRIATLF